MLQSLAESRGEKQQRTFDGGPYKTCIKFMNWFILNDGNNGGIINVRLCFFLFGEFFGVSPGRPGGFRPSCDSTL